MTKYSIWGPAAGSSKIDLSRSEHGRIVIHAFTDFGEAKCHFNDAQALKIRDVLNCLLGL